MCERGRLGEPEGRCVCSSVSSAGLTIYVYWKGES